MSTIITLSIPAVSCHHCINTITRETMELPGVINVAGSVKEKTATFTLEHPGDLDEVKRTLAEIGYPAADW